MAASYSAHRPSRNPVFVPRAKLIERVEGLR